MSPFKRDILLELWKKYLSYKKLIIFISSSNKSNIISRINIKVLKDVKWIMSSEFLDLLPSVFVPMIGLVVPAVFIVLIGRFITATE